MAPTLGPEGGGLERHTVAQTWDGERLRCYSCRLGSLAPQLPRVDRRPFTLARSDAWGGSSRGVEAPRQSAENPYYDIIVRLPQKQGESEVPLGVVSKRYQLVQHSELLDGVIAGLNATKLPWETLQTDVRVTELGSRLHFTIHLPEIYRAVISNDTLDLTIECLNSVDRSWAFRVGMGWIRRICGNGLFVGRVTASMRRPHVESLRLKDVPSLLVRGFEAAQIDSSHWQKRAQMRISPDVLAAWVDDIVTKRWGLLAATRTIHIAQTGFDARLREPKEKAPASRRAVVETVSVPGSEPPNDDIFRVAQALAWIANSPTEWGARLERRRQIPELLAPLAALARRSPRRVNLHATGR